LQFILWLYHCEVFLAFYYQNNFKYSDGSLLVVRKAKQQHMIDYHYSAMVITLSEPSRRLLHLSGTVCRRQYDRRRHYQFSAVD